MFEPLNTFADWVVDVIQSYGWYMLLSGIVLYYLMSKIWPTIENYLNHRQEQAYVAKYHKNPDLLTERIIAQERLTQRLQEKYNKDVELRKEKLKELEAKKREDILSKNQDISVGRKLGSHSGADGNSKSLRPEYNPLMGDNSRTYRPVRKSPCSGGGCGR